MDFASSTNPSSTRKDSLENEFYAQLPEAAGPKVPFSKASAFRLNYKTELCRNWLSGFCEFGEKCAFAHGSSELRVPQGKTRSYKTKDCIQFHKLGYCPYGTRCQFIHSQECTESAATTAASSRRNSCEAVGNRRLQVFRELAEGISQFQFV